MANDNSPRGLLGQTPIFGGFFRDDSVPYHQANLDPGTQEVLQNKITQASEGTQGLVNRYTEGTEGGRNLLRSPEQMQRQDASLGMANHPAVSEALNRRSQRSFNSDLNRIQQNAITQAPVDYMNNLDTSGKSFTANQALQSGQFQRAVTQQYNELNARNAVLGSVLGLAGTAAGFLLGGGPTGAAAGGKAGTASAGPQQGYQMGQTSPTQAK
jgi:hypothetical protein